MILFTIKLRNIFLRRHNISICMKSCISSYSPALLSPTKSRTCSFSPFFEVINSETKPEGRVVATMRTMNYNVVVDARMQYDDNEELLLLTSGDSTPLLESGPVMDSSSETCLEANILSNISCSSLDLTLTDNISTDENNNLICSIQDLNNSGVNTITNCSSPILYKSNELVPSTVNYSDRWSSISSDNTTFDLKNISFENKPYDLLNNPDEIYHINISRDITHIFLNSPDKIFSDHNIGTFIYYLNKDLQGGCYFPIGTDGQFLAIDSSYSPDLIIYLEQYPTHIELGTGFNFLMVKSEDYLVNGFEFYLHLQGAVPEVVESVANRMEGCDVIVTSNVTLQILLFLKVYGKYRLSTRFWIHKVVGTPTVSAYIYPDCLLFKLMKALGILKFYMPEKLPPIFSIVDSKE